MPFQKGNTLSSKRKGKKLPKTLEKEAILKAYQQRVMRSTDRLLNYQFSLARGSTYLFKIEKEVLIGPKGGRSYRSKKPVLVTDEKEILMYLEGNLIEGDKDNDKDPASTYYYITAKDPDPTAIKDMLDRTFGKPAQGISLQDSDGQSLPITQINFVPIKELK